MHDSSAKLRRRDLGVLALSGVLASAGARAATESRPRIGTYGGAGCTGVPEVKAFEAWLGRPMDVVLDFLDMSSWDAMVKETPWIGGCWPQLPGRKLVLSVPMLTKEDNLSLVAGARGAYDQKFIDVAQALVRSGYADAILRIGWEFNGDWVPWSARRDPAAFVAYWRRIARVMRGVPSARFRFDWNPSMGAGASDDSYPGDDVVDVIGLDAYNQSWPVISDPARRWQHLLNQQAGLRWHRSFAQAHGKPRSFAEWGTGDRPDGHGGGDDPLFVRNMLAWMQEGGPVEYACYWNYRAGDYDAKVTDGRLPGAAKVLRDGLLRMA